MSVGCRSVQRYTTIDVFLGRHYPARPPLLLRLSAVSADALLPVLSPCLSPKLLGVLAVHLSYLAVIPIVMRTSGD